jgi:small-conductance mechanosensitive channel
MAARLALSAFAALAFAAQEPAPADAAADAAIAERIERIFSEIESLDGVEVESSAGVVTLSGVTATAAAADRAVELAGGFAGVVTVENRIERDVSVETRQSPAIAKIEAKGRALLQSLPLVALAAAVAAAIFWIGVLIARAERLWARITPNPFIAEIAKSAVRTAFVIGALVAALSLLDATAFIGAVLGAAGVLGIAVGFAVRDPMENYITSIMLSLRQPFRPNDFVSIDGREGRVLRLTSRAAILLTLDGNHLRIPNSAVFKAVIVNYTSNPERRIEFEIPIAARQDPLAAMEAGLERLAEQEFTLAEPKPSAHIKTVSEANAVLVFWGWIDQRRSDFFKSRSAAIAAVRQALGEAARTAAAQPAGAPLAARGGDGAAGERPPDTAPERHIAEKVDEERRLRPERDLLNPAAPRE